MRFASLGGQSNYAQAGKAVADDANKTFKAARRSSIDFGGLAQRAMVTKAEENIAQTKADTLVRGAEIKQESREQKQRVAKAGMMRKAGGVAAAGLAGLMEKPEKSNYSAYDKRIAGIDSKLESDRAELAGMNTPAPKKTDAPDTANTGGTGASNASTTSSSGGGGGSNISSIANGSYSGSLDSLSPEDKKWIAYTVSSEAAMNTDDEFGVAGVIINRMKSGNYPTSAYDVGHQKGQFEGVQIGNSVHDQALHDRLFSPQGLQKLEGALTTLDGRDSFKGQALLHNRSSKGNKDGKLDPMFHSSGNYFHHSWQT